MARDTFELEPVSPFRLDLTVWTLRRRPDNVVDRWDGTTYRRVLPLPTGPVEVAACSTVPGVMAVCPVPQLVPVPYTSLTVFAVVELQLNE